MQYMLMCCFNEKVWAQLPDGARDKIMQEYGALLRSLAQSHQLRASGQLGPIASATTVRMKNGNAVLTDGPFTETKEQIGGFHLIECQNLDEALSIARRIPTLPAGGVIEVRPFTPSSASVTH
jgi:hypothetical protein